MHTCALSLFQILSTSVESTAVLCSKACLEQKVHITSALCSCIQRAPVKCTALERHLALQVHWKLGLHGAKPLELDMLAPIGPCHVAVILILNV